MDGPVRRDESCKHGYSCKHCIRASLSLCESRELVSSLSCKSLLPLALASSLLLTSLSLCIDVVFVLQGTIGQTRERLPDGFSGDKACGDRGEVANSMSSFHVTIGMAAFCVKVGQRPSRGSFALGTHREGAAA